MRGSTRAKIVATIGPASASAPCIEAMVEAGVDTFRLNLSHGSEEDHARAIGLIRAVEHAVGKPIAIMADLPGPKIRLDAPPVTALETGGHVSFSTELNDLKTNQPAAIAGVAVGDRVLLDDGAIRLRAVEQCGGTLRCEILKGGVLRPKMGVNVPDSDTPLAAVGARDRLLAAWAVAAGADLLAVSFCRDGDDIRRLREELGGSVQFVAKIERPIAVANIDDILEASEFMLVARGDLGVEMDIAEVPVIQKQLLDHAKRHGRPSIVATQMLQSMIEMHTPTRAEASDVANAILDGADAVMLSGETAIGHDPTLAVAMMDRIARTTETYARTLPLSPSPEPGRWSGSATMAALARGAYRTAVDVGADVVVVWSKTGDAARLLSREPFGIPIVALSDDVSAARRMQLLRGVEAIHTTAPSDRHALREALPAFLRGVLGGVNEVHCVLLSPPVFTHEGGGDVIDVVEVAL